MSVKLKRGHPNGGAKCRCGTSNADAIATDWRLSTRSIDHFGRKFFTLSVHLLCLQHVRHDTAISDLCFVVALDILCRGISLLAVRYDKKYDTKRNIYTALKLTDVQFNLSH